MQRLKECLKEYCRILAWQTGIGYLLLWAVTYWTLDDGPTVFGRSGVCHADAAAVLFYWTCDPASPLQILAGVANSALTATVWAPVYVAAATVDHAFIAIAAPIVAAHMIGLPLALFVLIRTLARAFDRLRRFRGEVALAPGPLRKVSAGSDAAAHPGMDVPRSAGHGAR